MRDQSLPRSRTRAAGNARRALAGLLAASLLLDGGAQAESISPKSLKPAAAATVLHIDKSFRYEDPDSKGMFASATPERGLLAGDYVAELEDKDGTFYRGKGTCVLVMTLPKSRTQIFGEGGVYVPKDPAKPFRLYRYRQLKTEQVLSAEPDANGDWSVPAGKWEGSLLVIGAVVPARREPGPPESLCGAPPAPADAASQAGSVMVVATVPRSPIGSGLGSGLSTLLINAMIESGRGEIYLMPAPPADVVQAEARLLWPTPPSAVEPDVPASTIAASTGAGHRPRHLDATMLDGHTWTFPHPRDPQRFGQLEFRFIAGGGVQASNARSSSAGRYVVHDDQVCMDFDSPGWPSTCYFVEDVAPAPDAPPVAMIVIAATGRRAPLTIR